MKWIQRSHLCRRYDCAAVQQRKTVQLPVQRMERPKQQRLKGARDEDDLVEVREGRGDGVAIRTGDRHSLTVPGEKSQHAFSIGDR